MAGGDFAVSKGVSTAALERDLGNPVSDAESLGKGNDTAQFFERGLVTVRGGRVQAWTSTSS
ncbi:hypothetical protein [Dactylosporangium sp. NPDC050588]|uniref:hypothetical protein n=1 Tax=Dactylosporangium sp. NPDC050588 TaxID=3157211 RepID=UPI0033FBB8B7